VNVAVFVAVFVAVGVDDAVGEGVYVGELGIKVMGGDVT